MASQRPWLVVTAGAVGGLLLAVGSFAITTALVAGDTPQPQVAPLTAPVLGADPFGDEGQVTPGPSRLPRASTFPAPDTEVVDPDPLRSVAGGDPGGVLDHRAHAIEVSAIPEAEPTVDFVVPDEDSEEPRTIDELVADYPEEVELGLPGPVPVDDLDALATLGPSVEDAEGDGGTADPLEDPEELARLLDPGAMIRVFEDLDRDEPLLDELLGDSAEEEACEGWLDCFDPLGWWTDRGLTFLPNFLDPCAGASIEDEDTPDAPFAALDAVECGDGIGGTVLAITGGSRIPRVLITDASRPRQYEPRCTWEDVGGHPLLLTSSEPILGGMGELRQLQLDGTFTSVDRFELPATDDDEVARWRGGELTDLDHWAARRLHTCVTVEAPPTRLRAEVTAAVADGSQVWAWTEIQQGLGGLRGRPPIELTGHGSSLAVTVPLISERNETTSDVAVIRADGLDGAHDCASFDQLEDAAERRAAMGGVQRHSFYPPGRGTFPVDRRAMADANYPYIRNYDLRQVHLLRIPAGVPHLVCVRILEVSSFGPDRTVEAQQFVAIAPDQSVDVRIQADGGDFRRAVHPGDISVVITHPGTNRELTDGISRGCWGSAPRSTFAAGDRGRDAGGPTRLCQTSGYGDLWPDEVDVRVTVEGVTQLQRIPIDRSRGPRRENFLIPVTSERRVCGESIFGGSCGNRDDVGALNLEVEYLARARGVGDELFVQPTGDYAERERIDTASLPELVRIDTSLRRVPGGVEPASLVRPISPWAVEVILVPDRDVTATVLRDGEVCRPVSTGHDMAQRVAMGTRERVELPSLDGPDDLDGRGVHLRADRRSRLLLGNMCPGQAARLTIVLVDDLGRMSVLQTIQTEAAGDRWVPFRTSLTMPGLPAEITSSVRFVYGPDPDAPRILLDYDLRTPVGIFASYLEGDGSAPCVTRSRRLTNQASGAVSMTVGIEAYLGLEYERMPTEEEWDARQRASRRGSLPLPCVSTEYLDEGRRWAGNYRADVPLRDLLIAGSYDAEVMTEYGAVVELQVRLTLEPSG